MSEIVIETKQLTKQYGTQKSVAELNIHVQRGRIYGLLGRNGAGNSFTPRGRILRVVIQFLYASRQERKRCEFRIDASRAAALFDTEDVMKSGPIFKREGQLC